MLFIPLPFVATILLIILLVTVLRRDPGSRINVPFILLIFLGAILTFLSGLRWGYNIRLAGLIAPVVSAVVPALAYCGVATMIRRFQWSWPQIAVHMLPAICIVGLIIFWPEGIDLALILTFTGYAVAILLMMRSGANTFALIPFESVDKAYTAAIFAALALMFSAILDLLVYLDFALSLGNHAMLIITGGNLTALFILSIAAAGASHSSGVQETARPLPPNAEVNTATVAVMDAAEYQTVLEAVDGLMTTKHVYRDVDLNLDRLARKLSIPTRHISNAINQAKAKNVSQYINEFRVAEACDLLAKTDKSVTEIMLDVGFQTKSNFNREFRRVTDMTPVEWRQSNT